MFRFAFCLLALTALSAFAQKFQEPTAAEAKAAIETFKFRGQWIAPQILKEFEPWESDYNLPLVTAVDIGAATGTNRFFGEVKGGNAPSFEANGETFRYQWLGRFKNGTHAVVTHSGGNDGTLVSTSLMFFRLREKMGAKEGGAKYRQILLELERAEILGDRAAVKDAKFKGNEVEIAVAHHGPEKTEVRKFKAD